MRLRRKSMNSERGAEVKSPWKIGERFFLPVLASARMHPRTVHAHAQRNLWIYAIDPAEIGLKQLGVKLGIGFETLTPGPVGARFGVEPSDPEPLRKRHNSKDKPAANPIALDLNDIVLAANDGLAPTTADPRFAAQMSYAVCEHVYALFARALGRRPHYGPWQALAIAQGRPHQLSIQPHAFEEDNAYYSPDKGTLEFGYFLNTSNTHSALVTKGSLQQYALSRDVISHELTHALLDGLRSHFTDAGHVDVAAFHEAFADLVAIFQHFTCAPLVEQAVEETGGVGVRALLDIGRQLGESDQSAGGQAMRSLISVVRSVSADSQAWSREAEAMAQTTEHTLMLRGDFPEECHDRGAVLVAAVMEAFLTVFERRARPIRRLAQVMSPTDTRGLPKELVQLLTELVLKLAEQFLRLLIRAIDYCPPVDIRFGDFLRALLTADYDLVPDDPHDYRGALVRAFRRRGVTIDNVLDMSAQSLRWADASEHGVTVPTLAFSKLRRSDDGTHALDEQEMRRWADALGAAVSDPQHIGQFGLRAPGGRYGPIVIESLNIVHRAGPDGRQLRGLVAEVTQTYRSDHIQITGGCTIHLNETGHVRYIIRKRVDSVKRRRALARLGSAGTKMDFAALHAKRHSVPKS
jgi:hypothetical protein